MARRLQCLWRTRVSRHTFLDVIVKEKRNRAARTIQRNIRCRAARLENAARLRLRRTRLEIFRRRYQTASFLRKFGLRTRKWQGRVRKVLDFFGLDPDTFQLSTVVFEFDRHHRESRWRMRSQDGVLDLSFEPAGRRSERRDAGFIASNFSQFFGRYTGTVRLPGETLHVDGLWGLAEDHYARW